MKFEVDFKSLNVSREMDQYRELFLDYIRTNCYLQKKLSFFMVTHEFSHHGRQTYPLSHSPVDFLRYSKWWSFEYKTGIGPIGKSFRWLKFLCMIRLDLFPSVIFSSCCLHNFILEVDGIDQDDKYKIEEEEQKEEDLDHNEQFNGEVKRDRISLSMWSIINVF